MDLTSILIWIVVGAIAGWLASVVMRTDWRQGLAEDIIIGIVGGFLGGLFLNLLSVGGGVTGLNLTSILTAFVGSVILIVLLRTLRRI
jgi:uncharacterized membrane protein YeaQ/YmgE (transglycosylase-associated protein family)